MRQTFALLTLAAIAASATAPAHAEVTRIKGGAGAVILQGALVPASAEVFYLSGQLASPVDPAKPTEWGDTKTQTISILTKIKGILEAKGYKMSDVFKMTIFAGGDPKLGGKMDFPSINEGFKMFFGTTENPNTVARSTVQVAALASPSALLEIEVIAAK